MKKLLTILCVISLGILISANASALQLIENGDFDDFFDHWERSSNDDEAGWTINADFAIFDPIDPEGPGLPTEPITPLADAKTDSPGFGEFSLSQAFMVPTEYIVSATLSWSDRIENYGDAFEAGVQEFRVDLFSTSPGDPFSENIFTTNSLDELIYPGPNERSFDTIEIDPDTPIDLAAILQPFAGQSLTLKFLQINEDYLNVTVDDISLEVEVGPAPVPEPATILLLSTGLIGLAGFGRIKR